MPPKVRILLVVIIAVTLLGGASWFYLHNGAQNDSGQLTLFGNVDIREVQPAFNASGRITRLLVQEGAKVQRGDLLATLDDTRYAAALAQAKASMEAAKITYQNDEVIYRRYTRLARTNATAIQQRDNARAEYTAALATYRAQQAAVAIAQQQFDDTRLYAPDDGVVENRILEPGDMASPSMPVFTIALVKPLWVRTYVPERYLGQVRTGMPATITTDSYPGHQYSGWIGFIASTAEFTPKTVETPELRTALVYQMRVYVCDGRNELRLGMPATVDIQTAPPHAITKPGCEPNDANAR